MDKDILDDAKEAFKLASEAEAEQRADMLDDLNFCKLAKQWDQADIDRRKAEGRPCLTINKLPAFVKQVTNDARQNRPAIKVHPVGDTADKEAAEIFGDLIRNIETSSSADVAYDTALDFSATCGIGYWVVRTDYADDDAWDLDLRIDRVGNVFSVYGDPSATAADSSDWNRAFITEMLREKDFKAKYPNAKPVSFQADGKDELSELWFEGELLRTAEYWVRSQVDTKLLKLSDGAIMLLPQFEKLKDILDVRGVKVEGTRDAKTFKVVQHIVSAAEVLETNEWRGKYIPIVPVYGDEVNIEGKRTFLSLIRHSKDPQRNFNYWRSAATELVALAPKTPYVGPAGSFETDSEKWATANTKSHPFIEYDPVAGHPPPQRQPFAGVPAGALQEALNASDDMKAIIGIYDASLGAKSNETSGRAILARQREGDIATFNFTDNLSRAIRHTGRILVDLVPKHYDVPRIVRCIKEDGTNYSVPLNQPVAQQPPQQPGGQPTFQAVPPEMAQQMAGISKVFDLAVGKYDVTCEAGPSFTTRREESAEQMMHFIQAFPQSAPLIGDLLAKNLDWPGADEIAKRLQAMLPPQIQGQSPQLQQATQIIQQLQQQMGQMQQQLQAAAADKNIDQQKVDVDKHKAETDRIKAETEQMKAEAEVALQALEQQQVPDMRVLLQMMQQLGASVQQMGQSGADVVMPAMQELAGMTQGLSETITAIGQQVEQLNQQANAPRRIVRDPSGKAIGVEIGGVVRPINRGPDGRAETY